MKVRLDDKSIRFRISEKEREQLNAGEQIVLHTHLSAEHPFECCLCVHKEVHTISCGFDGHSVCVELAPDTLETLNAQPEKGIKLPFPQDDPHITIVVEQDRPLRRPKTL